MVFARGHSNDSSTSLPLLASSSSSSPSPGRGYPPRPPSSSSPSPSTRRPSSLRILSKLLVPAASLTLISCVYLVVSSPPHLARERRLRPWTHRNSSNVDVFDKLTITSDDGNAKAVLIALGASLNELHVRDRNGKFRDVVVGYRDPTSSVLNDESKFAYFGATVGRYANRISNASFTDPVTNEPFDLFANERGKTTLHGGKWGYSRAGWNVSRHDGNEIAFTLVDHAAEGFPGSVETTATYSLLSSPTRFVTRFESKVVNSTTRTPISLSSHVYWNLDGYESTTGKTTPGGGMHVWVDARRTVEVDDELVPTGRLVEIEPKSPLDFAVRDDEGNPLGRELRDAIEDERSRGLCGKDCIGLDNALIYSNSNRQIDKDIVMTLASPTSGIKFKVRTNQPLVHLYTCNSRSFASSTTNRRGDYPLKPTQNGGAPGTYGRWSCLAVEQEGWIDGLHHEKEWHLEEERGNSQWYDSTRSYEWWAEYEFETF
ncbi:hypothetical protein JCM3766R1_000069 [Sporobolomyces carnicolor]